MSNKYGAVIVWSDEDDAFVATSPEFPGLSGVAPEPEDAVSELREAIEMALEEYEAEGREPPQPSGLVAYSGQFRLRVPKSVHAALAVWAEQEGVSLNTAAVAILTERLGYVSARQEAITQLSPFVSELIIAAQQGMSLHQSGSRSLTEPSKYSQSSGLLSLPSGVGH